ncbi:hypothetical protein OSB04_015106 [Centaurea solstitialis]|uniref:Retrovirus-related Pol polyprotein from transposon TNT 1-94-like beta-barrel domain-containing protein n=1 Tax=Centaurea solstitialis TaxID=347529 RepID=A0AA38WJT3_9ASTR|nr:hypothetical protein OSB04_015106 [Centaurea solstitialis]
MHTLSVAPPDDQWYMDTGATSHMTANGGNLTSYSHMSKNQNITVGSGHYIPINGYGNASLPNLYPPLTLKNVLHAPKLIKNLVSVRKFTIDNDVSIEFDPLGFTVKDLQTGMHLMRCNSKGDLYPITSTPFIGTSPPTAFAALSPELWHNRLGHPGAHRSYGCVATSSQPHIPPPDDASLWEQSVGGRKKAHLFCFGLPHDPYFPMTGECNNSTRRSSVNGSEDKAVALREKMNEMEE